jgi:hypothetical protein
LTCSQPHFSRPFSYNLHRFSLSPWTTDFTKDEVFIKCTGKM